MSCVNCGLKSYYYPIPNLAGVGGGGDGGRVSCMNDPWNIHVPTQSGGGGWGEGFLA